MHLWQPGLARSSYSCAKMQIDFSASCTQLLGLGVMASCGGLTSAPPAPSSGASRYGALEATPWAAAPCRPRRTAPASSRRASVSSRCRRRRRRLGAVIVGRWAVPQYLRGAVVAGRQPAGLMAAGCCRRPDSHHQPDVSTINVLEQHLGDTDDGSPKASGGRVHAICRKTDRR